MKVRTLERSFVMKLPTDKNLLYHLAAIFCILVWGTTFVSSKVLINHGLNPVSIFFCRFLIAYIFIWAIAPKRLFSKSLKDEFIFVLLGLTGGSLYFFSENTALKITYVNNVALLVCTAPLLTALLSAGFERKRKIGKRLIAFSLLALAGAALVVFNGNFVFQSNFIGDALSIVAALSWAVYTIALKSLGNRYSMVFVTRKVFIYGLLTMLPFMIIEPLEIDFAIIFKPVVLFNLIFLGIFASLVCFVLWNKALKHLDAVKISNYIYFNPLVTLITSALVLGEVITPVALVGAVFIVGGIFFAEKTKTNKP